jgi:FMN phosphatase YigB (HAD superfamily)
MNVQGKGVVSNSWGNTYPRESIDALFELVVISGEVGMRKPNPDIFTHALDLLGIPPERVVFVDAEPNTDGAARLGMHTVLHTDPDSTRQKLARLVPALETHISQHSHRTHRKHGVQLRESP